MKKYVIISKNKIPTTRDNYLGIELEFISKLNQDEMINLFIENDLEEYVQLVDDCSIDVEGNYHYSHELRVLVKENQMAKVVKKICKLLANNSTVNSSCGLHVHLDMRNKDAKQAYANLFALQPVLFAMCPVSRIESSYCNFTHDYQAWNGRYSGDRFVGVNRESYNRHKTFEIRIHSGTLNATKIINWVNVLLKVTKTKAFDNLDHNVALIKDLKVAKKIFNLKGKLYNYMKRRINRFSEGHSNNDRPTTKAA